MVSMDKIVKVATKTITEHSPAILTALGVAGVLTTAVFTAKASFAAARVIDDSEQSTGVSDKASVRLKERAKLVWKLYIPPAGMALATAACVIGVNSIHSRRNAALASAYTLTETALKEYQAQVTKHIGEREERKVRDNVADEQIRNNPVSQNDVIVTADGDQLFYDAIGGRYFRSTVEKVRGAQNDVNERVISHMYASLNTFYDALGLPPTEFGDDVGWHVGNMLDHYISAKVTEKNEPCLVVNHHNRPVPNYYKVF